MKVTQVLNLVRAECERLDEAGAVVVTGPVDAARLRDLTLQASLLVMEAASCLDGDLWAANATATRCASLRRLGRCCGECGTTDQGGMG